MEDSLVQIENRVGTPSEAHDMLIIPITQVVRGWLPGMLGGFIWNRPHHLMVRTGDDEYHILPVDDVTRRIQLTLLGVGLVGSLLIWILHRNR